MQHRQFFDFGKHCPVSRKESPFYFSVVQKTIKKFTFGCGERQKLPEPLLSFLNQILCPFRLISYLLKSSSAEHWNQALLQFFGIKGDVVWRHLAPVFPIGS